MKKKFILLGIVLIIICILIYYLSLPKKVSKIIVRELKTIHKPASTATTFIPIATLPKENKEKKFDILEGKIVSIPMDSYNPVSPRMACLLEEKDNEFIVLTNVLYTNTLKKLYIGKYVILKGIWRKDVVIYGKRYKSFWVEDYELSKR